MRIAKSEMMRHAIFLLAIFAAAAMVYGPLNALFGSSASTATTIP